MNSYEKFKILCEARGVTVSYAMQQAGLSKSLATKWKQAEEFTPNADTLRKLAKYFNISMDYFMSDNFSDNYVTFNDCPEIIRLAHAMLNMAPSYRQEIIHYAQYLCPNAFTK